MKIHITNSLNNAIEGYNIVIFENLNVDFDTLSNNCCDFILANNIFDYVESKQIPEIIHKLFSKLRLTGKMCIGGKDINLFCKSVKNKLLSEEEASNIISKTKSLVGHSFVENIIRELGMKYTTQLNGVSYEITASRQ